MSNSSKEDEWTKVIKSKSRKVKRTLLSMTSELSLGSSSSVNTTDNFWREKVESEALSIVKKVMSAKGHLDTTKQQGFLHDFTKTLLDGFKFIGANFSNTKPKKIVCYGLGCFSLNITARYQMAFLCRLQEMFKIPVEIYDPVFTDLEKYVAAKHLDISVLPNNEGGMRIVNQRTLFYLPHCSHQLVNNLLYANWNHRRLYHCVIVSNSFSNIATNSLTGLENLKFIGKSLSISCEIPMLNNFEYTDIFNDSAVHVFPEDKMRALTKKDSEFWKAEEPVYSECDFVPTRKS